MRSPLTQGNIDCHVLGVSIEVVSEEVGYVLIQVVGCATVVQVVLKKKYFHIFCNKIKSSTDKCHIWMTPQAF